jgi:hypothetical protein
MITWNQFEQKQPALAAAGREQLYQVGIGLAFLATVRADGAPRVHPVCPVISPAGLHVLVIPGPKQNDLRRDGRYALHTETYPPPRQDDGVSLSGRAREITDPVVRGVVRSQLVAERGESLDWPGLDTDALFELRLDRCLLMLTHPRDGFPQGPTIWKALRENGAALMPRRSSMSPQSALDNVVVQDAPCHARNIRLRRSLRRGGDRP